MDDAAYHKIRLDHTQNSWSSAWLMNTPHNRHSIMSNDSFQNALKLRLGIPFHNRPEKCICKDKKPIDHHLTHILSCMSCARHNIENRHFEIQKDIHALAIEGHIRTSSYGISLDNGRRADLEFHGEGKNGKNLMADITIVSSVCASYMEQSFTNKNFAIENAERLKTTKYNQACIEQNVDFLPLVFEMFGEPSNTTIKIIQQFVKKASAVSKIPYHILMFYWKKRISTTLQKMNAAILSFGCNYIFNKQNNSEPIDVYVESRLHIS